MSELILIPSEELLPRIKEGIIDVLKDIPLGEVKIEKMEWDEKGIMVWIQREK